MGGPDAVLVVDDTALVKQGRHSVGVQRQYCGQLGKRANCQALVSLILARGEVPVPVPVPVGLRLFLPDTWVKDADRRRAAGVPDDIKGRPKWLSGDRVNSCAHCLDGFLMSFDSGGLRWTRSAACEVRACGLAACWAMPSMARSPCSAMRWTRRACCLRRLRRRLLRRRIARCDGTGHPTQPEGVPARRHHSHARA